MIQFIGESRGNTALHGCNPARHTTPDRLSLYLSGISATASARADQLTAEIIDQLLYGVDSLTILDCE